MHATGCEIILGRLEDGCDGGAIWQHSELVHISHCAPQPRLNGINNSVGLIHKDTVATVDSSGDSLEKGEVILPVVLGELEIVGILST